MCLEAGDFSEEIVFKKFNALDELFNRTKEKRELECIDLLGNILKYTFEWKPAINIENLAAITETYKLNLPIDYRDFLLKANGAILYNNIEDAGYELLSIEDAIELTKEMSNMGYDLKNDWLIFMTTMFNSNILLFDLSKLDNNIYIIDGRQDCPIDEWKYLKSDFRVFMNKIFMANGGAYLTW